MIKSRKYKATDADYFAARTGRLIKLGEIVTFTGDWDGECPVMLTSSGKKYSGAYARRYTEAANQPVVKRRRV